MARAAEKRSRKRDLAAFLLAGVLPAPWMAVSHWEGLDFSPEITSLLAGAAILGAAFLLSWATELAERDIPQSLAILVLALVSVLPEYAVDLHFAWTAGKDLSYAGYAVANMTGANRLLIGLGWSSVVLIYCARSGFSEVVLHQRQRLELRFLVWATLYSFLIPLNGEIDLIDAAVLLAIFLGYAAAASRGESEEVELVGPALLIDREFSGHGRRLWVLALFAFSAWGIFLSAEPFAEGLVEMGLTRDIDEFLLVQWVAPLASESPEFLIAILFALRLRGSLGIGALISSKVNQWTLLVGAIPIAFCISAGGWSGLPLDERQTEELVLTSAQSLMAAVIISDLRFSRVEATGLAVLFLGQFLFPQTQVRWFFTGAYVAVTAALLMTGDGERRREFFALISSLPSSDKAREGGADA